MTLVNTDKLKDSLFGISVQEQTLLCRWLFAHRTIVTFQVSTSANTSRNFRLAKHDVQYSSLVPQLSTGHPKRGSEFTVATTTGNRLARGRIPNLINDEWYLEHTSKF
ncbi:MAG: hypothetical protein KME25_20985 [Symplocastrum torsivum CPER-KK1]|uniref:Uncharacterized protein n=1 Tax=Symplocastrum torsivum CPER-KK1 TaxID=450513 RepID=A0A951PQF9_9CYAN|nr:hypothetical protein [Symplocastrum torsivum CPER-KK1]